MENYHPDYIRLRLRGGQGREMVSGYTGRSAVQSEGFDPAVVPTLVDLADRGACPRRQRRDLRASGPVLAERRPGPAAGQAKARDRPRGRHRRRHCRMWRSSTGRIRMATSAPRWCAGRWPAAHDTKIMKLMEGRSLSVGHPGLIAAYDAKIRKEAAARHYVRTPDLMRGATREVRSGDRRRAGGAACPTGGTGRPARASPWPT
jgi:hypothetical protein